MIAMDVRIRVCIGFKVYTNWRLLECSWASLNFVVTKLLCFHLCLFHTIVELHDIVLKKIQRLSSWTFYVQ